jgi:hypothetical protein
MGGAGHAASPSLGRRIETRQDLCSCSAVGSLQAPSAEPSRRVDPGGRLASSSCVPATRVLSSSILVLFLLRVHRYFHRPVFFSFLAPAKCFKIQGAIMAVIPTKVSRLRDSRRRNTGTPMAATSFRRGDTISGRRSYLPSPGLAAGDHCFGRSRTSHRCTEHTYGPMAEVGAPGNRDFPLGVRRPSMLSARGSRRAGDHTDALPPMPQQGLPSLGRGSRRRPGAWPRSGDPPGLPGLWREAAC